MSPAKERRSRRVAAKHGLIVTVRDETGSEVAKETVTTMELSRNGARIRGRRILQAGWRGDLLNLRSLRKVPFRVAWPSHVTDVRGYFDTGVEFTEDLDFWGETYATASRPESLHGEKISLDKFVEDLLKSAPFQAQESGRLMEAILCGLVEQLEERNIFTRAELVAGLRELGQL